MAERDRPPAKGAINGYLWSGGEGTAEGQPAAPLSTVITNYHVIRDCYSASHDPGCLPDRLAISFARSPDGVAIEIGPSNALVGDEALRHYAIGSDFPLLENGVCVATKPTDAAARSAIGYSDDSIILLATDYPILTQGLNKDDLCSIMKSRGATTAATLDGGPSSAMVVGGQLVTPLPFPATVKYAQGFRYVATAIGVVDCGEGSPCEGDGDCCAGFACNASVCRPRPSQPLPPPGPGGPPPTPAPGCSERCYDGRCPADVAPQNGLLVQRATAGGRDNSVWIVSDWSGIVSKAAIPSASCYALCNGGDFASVRCVSGALWSAWPDSGKGACTDGSFVRTSSSPTVYRQEAGTLRPLCGSWDEASFRRAFGTSWASVIPVCSAYLAAFPAGPCINAPSAGPVDTAAAARSAQTNAGK